MERPLPTARMREKWGSLPYLRYVGGGNWAAACPDCGDYGHDPSSGLPDRFVIWGPGTGKSQTARGWCRRCGHLEFADEDEDYNPTPEEIAEVNAEREKWERQQRKKRKEKQQWLQEADFWVRFHENMTDEQRLVWHKEGIHDWAIELHKLGYRPGRNGHDGALSIPYFAGGWDRIITLQYRLLCPEEDGGKYRFLKGAHAELFRPWPEDKIKGVVLILEGAKKALVTYEEAYDIKYLGEDVTMVALPSKVAPERLVRQLDDAEMLIWMLDPDAYEPAKSNGRVIPPAIKRNIELAGSDRSRIVRTAAKIDDMIIKWGLKKKTIEAMINQAGPYYGYRA